MIETSDIVQILRNSAQVASEEIIRLRAEINLLKNDSVRRAIEAMQQMKELSREVRVSIDAACEGLDVSESRIEGLERLKVSLVFEVRKLRDVLKQVRREYGHWSINMGTTTLDVFIGAVLKATDGVDLTIAKDLGELFAELTDEERCVIISGYRHYCGKPDGPNGEKCQCWNDE